MAWNTDINYHQIIQIILNSKFMSATTSSKSSLRIWIGGIILVAGAAIAILMMIARHNQVYADDTKSRISDVKAGPYVSAVIAGKTAIDNSLIIQGEARPYQEVTLYAKTSGYMSHIYVDKGDRVSSGQLMAEIVSPETDQAYQAAIADLENKKKILARDKALLAKEYIATQDEQQTETDVAVAAANVESLRQQQQYKNITAPFSGTVTARFADPGALIQTATNSQTSAQPIVTVSELDRIRVYVYVEQAVANNLKLGYPVEISMLEKPNFSIKGNISRISGELDPKTRMMLVEVDLPNKDGEIIPGSYVNVKIAQPTAGGNQLAVPSEAVVLKNGKPTIGVIGADSTIQFKPVTLGDNDGSKVVVISGIEKGELIGLNVGTTYENGQKVRVKYEQ
jgi:membrane fusion protein (multidrug efflux system)